MIFFQALSVGIFAYVLKLLQSSARELRPLLVFIWAKILAVDSVSYSLLNNILQRSSYMSRDAGINFDKHHHGL